MRRLGGLRVIRSSGGRRRGRRWLRRTIWTTGRDGMARLLRVNAIQNNGGVNPGRNIIIIVSAAPPLPPIERNESTATAWTLWKGPQRRQLPIHRGRKLPILQRRSLLHQRKPKLSPPLRKRMAVATLPTAKPRRNTQPLQNQNQTNHLFRTKNSQPLPINHRLPNQNHPTTQKLNPRPSPK